MLTMFGLLSIRKVSICKKTIVSAARPGGFFVKAKNILQSGKLCDILKL